MRWRGTATCAPLVRRSTGSASGSSNRRSSSAQGPVAFTTTSARTLYSCPLSTSRTAAPRIRASGLSNAVTSAWFATRAPACAAARMVASVSRASSVCASK